MAKKKKSKKTASNRKKTASSKIKSKKSIRKKQAKQASRSQPNFFDKIYLNYIEKFPFLTFLILLLLIAGFVFWDFIILEKVYLFKDIGSDTINIFYPSLHMNKALDEYNLLYTFRNGLGAPVSQPHITKELLGYLTAPHTRLVDAIVLSFTDEVAYLMFFRQFANILLGAIVFFFYLKVLGVKKITNIAGALIFAFSGVMILGSVWVFETKLMLYAAFMLFSFELMLKKKTWLLFPVAVFISARSMGLFWFYPFGLLLIAYMLVRYFEEYEWNFKHFSGYVLKVGGLALIGVLLNSASFYQSIITLLNNPRVTGDVSLTKELMEDKSIFAEAQFYITALLRMFSSDMAGGGIIDKVMVNGQQYLVPEYRGWQNYYEGPIFYVSLLTLLLIPAFYTNSNKKNKIILALYMLIFALPVLFPYFLRAFWAFKGEYFRGFSFVIIFPYFYTAIRGFDNIEKKEKLNPWLILTFAIALVFLLSYLINQLLEINPQFYNLSSRPYNSSIGILAGFLILLYALLLVLFKLKKNLRKSVLVVILLILGFELAYMSNITINKRSVVSVNELESKTGYNDYTMEALEYIAAQDSGFYRIEKEYKSGAAVHGSLNDAFVQGYFGTSKYSSSPDPRFLKFIQNLELAEKGDELAARWIAGVRTRPLLFTILNGKYILSKNAKSEYTRFGYEKTGKTGDVHIYKNRFAIPLGVTYDKYILKSDFDSLSLLQKDIALLRAVLVADSIENQLQGLKKYTQKDTTTGFNFAMYNAFTDSLKGNSLKIENFRQDRFEGSVSLSETTVMYFSILYDNNWIVEVDNKPVDTFTANLAFTGVKINKGKHKIKVFYKPKKKKTFAIVNNIIGFLVIISVVLFYLFRYFVLKKKVKKKHRDF